MFVNHDFYVYLTPFKWGSKIMTDIKNDSNISFSNEDVSKYGLKLIELINK